MKECTEHQSMHARKSVVHFGDEITQCPGYSKFSRLPKAPVKPTIPSISMILHFSTEISWHIKIHTKTAPLQKTFI